MILWFCVWPFESAWLAVRRSSWIDAWWMETSDTEEVAGCSLIFNNVCVLISGAEGSGFVPIREPAQYALLQPLRYDGLPPPDYCYSLSAFVSFYVQAINVLKCILILYVWTQHRIHCLVRHRNHHLSRLSLRSKSGPHPPILRTRQRAQRLLLRQTSNVWRKCIHTENERISHCFDYLWQAMMCYGSIYRPNGILLNIRHYSYQRLKPHLTSLNLSFWSLILTSKSGLGLRSTRSGNAEADLASCIPVPLSSSQSSRRF